MRESPESEAWSASGAAALTGRTVGPCLVPADAVIRRAQALGAVLDEDVLALLGERAAIAGFHRAGDASCGGAARLLAAADGWVAVNLPRDEDREAIAAWLGTTHGADVWASVADAARSCSVAQLVEGVAPLGLPVAGVGEVNAASGAAGPVVVTRANDGAVLGDAPLVVDLSSLWAGPLCARLLRERGARVIKVESWARPDGARRGPAAFFQLMHANAQFVGLDLAVPSGRHALRALLARADVVIEASRPRALRQLGTDAASMMAEQGPRVWISITGYGRDRDRVAFGDDAAAAGGLLAWDAHGPCFAGDAVADPLAGVAVAAAATEALAGGGRWILDVALARVAAHVAGSEAGRCWRPSRGTTTGRHPAPPGPAGERAAAPGWGRQRRRGRPTGNRHSMSALLIKRAEVDGALVNVAVAGARIVAVGPDVTAPPGAPTVDAGGGALLPGLHDHHVHLLALAASEQSVDVSPATTPDLARFAAALTEAAARAPAGQWLRATGYHERVAGELDRWRLDAIVRDRPLRVQHRSGALWILNSAALAATGLLDGGQPEGCLTDDRGVPTGQLLRLDEWLGRRLPRLALDLSATGRIMAGFGFTGATDATPYRDTESMAPLAEAVDAGALPLDVMVTGSPALEPARIPLALRPGPAKLLLLDHALPPPDQIADWIGAARRFGRPVAVHCVTAAALVVTLSALAETGAVAGDRIEHGAVVGADVRPLLRASGVTVVTQPNFVAERGDDYLADVAPDEQPDLWPVASLLAAGIPVAAGTDAPYGRPDPWALVHAAATRRTAAGHPLGPAERLDPRRALDLLLGPADRPGGPPRRVAAGAPADLCLLWYPLEEALARLPVNPVRATFRVGQQTYGDPE